MRNATVPALGLAFLLWTIGSCAKAPEPVAEPAAEAPPAPPPAPAKFAVQPFHRSMSEGMRASYARADEILVGLVEGVVRDKTSGLTCYVSEFRRFDKTTLAWQPRQSSVMQVSADKLRPEIIRLGEFGQLIDLDKTGICWDLYEGVRNIYLVEGQENLLFLEHLTDESGEKLTRGLIDTYPATRECRAVDVFVLMVRDLVRAQ
ncbi:MAG: hypothetical protein FJY79_07355 [Candidatus Aminicenantes bacterium]|nr:hypothetical protein [Candidatus Aminicenantes bacterium]